MQNLARRATSSDLFWFGLAAITMIAACALIAGGLVTAPVLVVAAAIAILGWAVIFGSPYIGIVLFLALLFLRPEQFFPNLMRSSNPDEGLSSFTLFAYVVIGGTLFVWLTRLLMKREQFRWAPELGWVTAYAAIIVLSSYQVPDAEYTLSTAMDAAKMFCFFLLLQQLVNSERRVHLTIQWFLLFVVGLAISGIVGWVTGANVMDEHGVMRARVGGPFASPNALAAALVLAIPIAALVLLRAKNVWMRLWGGLALGILVTGLYLTNSRSGSLGLAMALGTLFILQFGWARGAMLAGAFAAVMLALGPERFVHDTFSHQAVAQDDSAMNRIIAWSAGLDLFQHRPIFGVGYQRYLSHHWLEAHNSFVQALVEVGLPGVMCWVGLNYWALLSLVRVRRQYKGEPLGLNLPGYAAAVQAGLMGSLLSGMFLNRAYRIETLIPVALAAGLALVAARQRQSEAAGEAREEPPPAWPHLLAIPAVTLACIVGVYLSITKFQ